MAPPRTPTGRESRDQLHRVASNAAHLMALLGAIALAVGLMIFVNRRDEFAVGLLACVLGVLAIVLSLLVHAAARVLIALFDMVETLLRRDENQP